MLIARALLLGGAAGQFCCAVAIHSLGDDTGQHGGVGAKVCQTRRWPCSILTLLPVPTPWRAEVPVRVQSVTATILCMLDVAAGGLLVANGQMQVLVRAMGITLGATAAYFTLTGLNNWNSLGSVWWGLAYFFAFRLAQSCRALFKLFA